MKKISIAECERIKNSKDCEVIEYKFNDKRINIVVIELSGRYPDSGWVRNKKCKEIYFVIEGRGELVLEKTTVKISKGDSVIIDPGEWYYWKGMLRMTSSSTPAWYFEQHEQKEA